MNYGYIYKITYKDKRSHLFNHFYYGQHKYRKGESLLDPDGPYYYHGSSIIAYRTYWPYYTEHTKEIICWADTAEELDNLERNIIKEHINDPLCINVAEGGNGGSTGNPSEETRRKISESKKDKPTWSLGKTFSDKHKHNMSIYHWDTSGEKNPMYGKTSTMKGKHYSEDVRKHYSEAQIGSICVNNGIECKRIKQDKLEYYLNNGYQKGMLKRVLY